MTAANAAANAAAMALAATGTPHGRVPKRQAPTPPGLRDLSEAVLWAQTVRGGEREGERDAGKHGLRFRSEEATTTPTENQKTHPPLSAIPNGNSHNASQEAFEEAAWTRRAAELSDSDALEQADAALERYDWRCSLLAELFDGVPVSEALARLKKTAERETAPRSLAETVRALEQGAAATSTSTSAAAAASSSASASAAASAASSEFKAILSELSQARTRAEVSAAEQAYLSLRARRRRARMRRGNGRGGEEGEGQEQAPLAVAASSKRRTVAPGLFEILLGGRSSAPDPPAGPGLEL